MSTGGQLLRTFRVNDVNQAETTTARTLHRGFLMVSTADDLRQRLKRFAFGVINLVKSLSRNTATDAIARQLIRSGTGVAANHRGACRARSRREFIARLAVALEEADETELWLETLMICDLAAKAAVAPLYAEAREIRAILSASVRTARARDKSRQSLPTPQIPKSSNPQIEI
ncbi:MAG: four helix bundle protein [Acidobacteriia bacterium]|nr:four helix bundle protein [Terriglobia bacterium]